MIWIGWGWFFLGGWGHYRACCTFEYVRDRMDLTQRGICGKEYTTLTLFSHGWGVDLMVNTGNRLASQLFHAGLCQQHLHVPHIYPIPII